MYRIRRSKGHDVLHGEGVKRAVKSEVETLGDRNIHFSVEVENTCHPVKLAKGRLR